MGRLAGRHNADFAAVRARMLGRLRRRLDRRDGLRASFRQLATAAGVSVPTLRYYFGDRVGVLRAVMEHDRRQGTPFMDAVARSPLGTFPESVVMIGHSLREGFGRGLGRVFLRGFAAGVEDSGLGLTCVTELLEPSLQCVEVRLIRHRDVGDIGDVDARVAALQLLSPILLLLLHQLEMGGTAARPANYDEFLTAHAASLQRAFAPQISA